MTRIPQDPEDPFERAIRAALAEEAAEPAPDRLVTRIARSRAAARIPPTGIAGWAARLGRPVAAVVPLLAAAAAVAILVLAGGILTRPPEGGTSPVPVSQSPAPSEPSASATPTPAASAPTGSATPATGPAAIGPVPADFAPVSVTFVSSDDGWLLGSTACGDRSCAAVARTTDGGLTWERIPAPPTVADAGDPSEDGVDRLRFANALDGWAYGSELWATHDGGATWHRLTLPGGGGSLEVMDLEAAAGIVHVAFWGDGLSIRIASGPVGDDTFEVSPTALGIGAGPVPQLAIVLDGSAGWLVQVNRAVIGGARLSNGGWQPWSPPCLDTAGPAWLAARSTTDLVAACDIGVWATPMGVHLFTSRDGGSSFTEQPVTVPLSGLGDVAVAPGSETVVAAGFVTADGAVLVASLDGGRSWATVATIPGGGSFSELGFTTTEQGVAIAANAGGGRSLVVTRDGGRTWGTVNLDGG